MNSILKHLFFIIPILLAVSQPVVFSQDSIMIKGKIVGNRHQPLSDVSVSIKGYNIDPVVTGEDGNFQIKSPSTSVWLIITPVGSYKGKEIYLNNRNSLTISISPEDISSEYDPIRVVNQNIEPRNIIAAHTELSIEDLDKSSLQSVDQYFQGRVPGMYVINHSGMPGLGSNIHIRGVNSMLTNNMPLFVVDGLPLEMPGLFYSMIDGFSSNPINNINPSDITRITVLKDPLYTSLYGAKGSNGVVLIQTLEPEATQTIIDVSYRTGINMIPKKIPQLNRDQYKTLANEILMTSGRREEFFEEDYPGLYITEDDDGYYRYQHDTKWQDLIFSSSVMNNMFVRVKGGGERAKFGLSLGNISDNGIYDNTGYNRTNFRFLTRLDVTSWFRMDINANLTYSNMSLRASAITEETNPILAALAKPPLLNPYQYDQDGNELKLLDEVDELATSNPLAVINEYIGDNTNYRFISHLRGQADLSENLKWNSILGLNLNSSKEFIFMPNAGMDLYFSGQAHNVSQSVSNYLYSFYTDNFLVFGKDYGLNALNFTSGIRVNTNSLQSDWGEAKNAPENDEYRTLGSGQSELRQIGGQNGNWNWLSTYAKVDFSLRDKFLFSIGGSMDYSTRIGKDAENLLKIGRNPFGLFYSMGAAWRLSSEQFLKNVDGLEDLKLRLSYGTSGNDDIGNYNSFDYYTVVKYRETTGLIPGSLPNPSLSYEIYHQLNLGLDLSLWGDRTAFQFDLYKTNVDNMIYNQPQEAYLGFLYKLVNGGKIENKGWEFNFYQRIFDRQNFKWDLSINLSHWKNKVLNLNGKEIITPFRGGEFITRESTSINSFYGYSFEGVYSSYEEAQESGLVNEKGVPYGAGDSKYKDISGPEGIPDGVINYYDKTVIGSVDPDYFGALINSLKYKRWYLNIMIQFVYGNEIFNYLRYQNERMTDLSNQSTKTLKRWQREGDITDVPRALWNDPMGNSSFSSRWIEDGSVLRVKTITLGYSIPTQFLIFRNADFFVTATNLFSIDKYLGYDPEFSYSYSNMEQGLDYGLMPQHRNILIGVKLGL